MAFAASKRKRIKGPSLPFEQLKLTSLIDMFTIILVFLLKSYSAVEFNVPGVEGLAPADVGEPEAAGGHGGGDGGEERGAGGRSGGGAGDGGTRGGRRGRGGAVGAAGDDGAEGEIQPVLSARRRAGRRRSRGKITVQADRDVPHKLLKRVIKSAGDAGFASFKLMAFKKE
ncbi:MAG: hypothetical protein M5R36_11055 [Deltaproteobacteria bacterium]|nr:hypothetical protein [Deltaproteobacteria bacterium]